MERILYTDFRHNFEQKTHTESADLFDHDKPAIGKFAQLCATDFGLLPPFDYQITESQWEMYYIRRHGSTIPRHLIKIATRSEAEQICYVDGDETDGDIDVVKYCYRVLASSKDLYFLPSTLPSRQDIGHLTLQEDEHERNCLVSLNIKDVVVLTISFLPVCDLYNMMQSCKVLASCVNWRMLVKEHYPRVALLAGRKVEDQDQYQLYKAIYRQRLVPRIVKHILIVNHVTKCRWIDHNDLGSVKIRNVVYSPFGNGHYIMTDYSYSYDSNRYETHCFVSLHFTPLDINVRRWQESNMLIMKITLHQPEDIHADIHDSYIPDRGQIETVGRFFFGTLASKWTPVQLIKIFFGFAGVGCGKERGMNHYLSLVERKFSMDSNK